LASNSFWRGQPFQTSGWLLAIILVFIQQFWESKPMKLSQIKLLALVLLLSASSGCVINRIRSKFELNECARAYKEGKFKEAEEHARRSLELNPEQKNADLFLARTIHAQFKPGVDSQVNLDLAESAIRAYQGVLQKNPDSEEAFQAIGYLYGQTKREELQKKWIETRAADERVSPANRANAIVFLASKEWQCSYDVTESPDVKTTAPKDGKLVFVFKMPKDPKDFEKAQQCTAKGRELVEKAISLDPNNERAWGYKTNLLLEAKKLAEMSNKPDEAANFGKEADAAQARTSELNAKKKAEEDAKKSPTPQ
jgi:tetratricopeptide (TPR) repeat protein